MNNNKIDKFCGKYEFLSNFFPAKVKDEYGLEYPSVEHAFQAMKTPYIEFRKPFQSGTPGQAKRNGRRVELRLDWEEVKIFLMKYLLRQKFNKQPFKDLLLETKDAELIEGNNWGDTFWGVCGGTGKNKLGILLMEIRQELFEEVESLDIGNMENFI